jgi:DNA primase
LTNDVINDFDVGYFEVNEFDVRNDRILFPVYGIDGRLLTYQARVMPDDPYRDRKRKYIHGSGKQGYDKSNHLYGLWNCAEVINQQGYAVLVEGPPDVLSIAQAGIGSIAGLTNSIGLQQAWLLRAFTKHVLIWLDNDNAGQLGTGKVVRVCRTVGLKYEILNTSFHDANDYLQKRGATELGKVIEYKAKELLKI